jgi:polar amino acid transport system permease protein
MEPPLRSATPNDSTLPDAPRRRAVARPKTSFVFALIVSVLAISMSALAVSALIFFHSSLGLRPSTSDRLFVDRNNNGRFDQDPKNSSRDEKGARNVEVRIFSKKNSTKSLRNTVTSDENGKWQIDVLPADTYTIGYTLPKAIIEAKFSVVSERFGKVKPDQRTAEFTLTNPATRRLPALAAEAIIGLLLLGGVLIPAARALQTSLRARRLTTNNDIYGARAAGQKAREFCWYTVSLSIVVAIVVFVLSAISNNRGGARKPFLDFTIMRDNFGKVFGYFLKKNLKVALIAFPLVLIWGLVLALMRLAPGNVGRPLRAMSTFYIDLFRGIPAIVNLTLIGFGLPISRLPLVSHFKEEQYAILAITITYGAYVAEVYRAGIDSIHWGQTAASRSLGLSNLQTMRYVVVPQAVRRIIPPLLNDFISIQKDTVLLSALGYFEVFSLAKAINARTSNLSAMTLVAFLFYVITIPQGRFVDRMLAKEQARTQGGK